MRTVFADTFYFFGILNRSDEYHTRCSKFASEFRGRLLTTDYILFEVADGLASEKHRSRTATFIRLLRQSPLISVIQASEHLFSKSREL